MMTNFSLTVNCPDVATLAHIVSLLGGTASVAAAPVTITTNDDDDDNAPMNTAAPAVDSAGLPWDERIHAPKKSVLKDGTWRKKKGIDDATVAAVESELRAKVASPMPQMSAGQPAPFVPPVAPVQQPSNFQPQAPVPQQVAAPAPMPAPVPQQMPQTMQQPAPMPQQPAQTPQPVDFAGFMVKMQSAMQGGRTDVNQFAGYVQEINQAWGANLNQITDLSQPQFAHMIGWVIDMLRAKGVIID